MVSLKATAAIALTLMIVVPILLGYGLASHPVETTQYESEDSLNLSDHILNSQTPYTNSSYTASNNTELMQAWTFPGSGVTEYHAVTPEYRETTTSNTAFPIYETHTGYYSPTAGTTDTHTSPGEGTVYRLASSNYPYEPGQTPNVFVNADAFSIGITTANTSSIHWEFETDTRVVWITPTTPLTFARDGSNTYTVTTSEGTYTGVEYWELRTDVDATFSVYKVNYSVIAGTEALPLGSIYSFETPATGYMSLKLSGAAAGGGDIYIATHDQAQPVTVNGATVTVGSTSYAGVRSVSMASGTSPVYMTYLTATGQYADPSYGWNVPKPADVPVYQTWWINNFSNQSVTFLMKFSGDATIYLYPTNDYGGISLASYKIASSGGQIYVNDTLLGGYSSISMRIATDGTTVSGITAWPAMGVDPTPLNSINLSGTGSFFNKVNLNIPDEDRTDVAFRVNATKVLAGYFPSTKDFTLSMAELFPDKSYSLKLNSIGIYGDSINIGSISYGVTDGRINVDGKLVPLKGALIKSIDEGGVYKNTINGYELGDTSAPAAITFGGEWSLTVTGDTLKETHPTHMEWSPGEFAFDKRDFAAVGLLVAGACMVGLGMMGKRSGVKIGVLMLVCGGAALVYLTMI